MRYIDVQHFDWPCTLEPLEQAELSSYKDPFALRMGLGYARGLRAKSAQAIVDARQWGPFASIPDLARRVPELRKAELVALAQIGALNSLGETKHRRDALWQAEYFGRPAGPLFASASGSVSEEEDAPLFRMSTGERLIADFHGTGLTVGRHPISYHRPYLKKLRIVRASDLAQFPDGGQIRIGGTVTARQRPGTAKGFVFLSIEDETGIANAIIHPKLYEQHRAVVTYGKFLVVEGKLQNQDGVLSVKASHVEPLVIDAAAALSHDFR